MTAEEKRERLEEIFHQAIIQAQVADPNLRSVAVVFDWHDPLREELIRTLWGTSYGPINAGEVSAACSIVRGCGSLTAYAMSLLRGQMETMSDEIRRRFIQAVEEQERDEEETGEAGPAADPQQAGAGALGDPPGSGD